MEWIFILQQKSFEQALEEYRKKLDANELKIAKIKFGKKIHPIVLVESDNISMGPALRSSRGMKAAVVAVVNSRGNFHIECNSFLRIDLDDSAAALNRWVQEEKERVVTSNWDTLRKSGTVPGAEEIHYYKHAKMIFNGSITHPEVPAVLNADKVFEAMKLGLDKSSFNSKVNCDGGSCINNNCDWKRIGLHRCRTVRGRQYKK